MLQAAYVTKNSFAASDSATIAGRHLPARGTPGITLEDFCAPCLDRHGKLEKLTDRGRHLQLCDACFAGVPSSAHRQRMIERQEIIRQQEVNFKRASLRRRQEALREMFEQFKDVIHQRHCALCGKKRGVKGLWCKDCKRTRMLMLAAKSWLRSYARNGNTKELSNACSLIRKYKLTPEDLKYV